MKIGEIDTVSKIFSQLEKKVKWWVYQVLVLWKSKANVKKYITPNFILIF